MADVNNKRRFATGSAGYESTPIEILNIDLDYWLLDPSIADLAAANSHFVWTPPDAWEPAKDPAAGVRLVMKGGVSDSIVRIGAFGIGRLTAHGGDVAAVLAVGPKYLVPADQLEEVKFHVPGDRSFGILIVSGGLAANGVELHWMRGV
ncbi:MAG: hypothetical protein JWO56_1684 [Acidobacteria bacterium]|nr:hypothetical protein [Acidobacteriota bacterium]